MTYNLEIRSEGAEVVSYRPGLPVVGPISTQRPLENEHGPKDWNIGPPYMQVTEPNWGPLCQNQCQDECNKNMMLVVVL